MIPVKMFYSMTDIVTSIMPRKYISLLANSLEGKLLIIMVIDTGSSLAFMVEAPAWDIYV